MSALKTLVRTLPALRKSLSPLPIVAQNREIARALAKNRAFTLQYLEFHRPTMLSVPPSLERLRAAMDLIELTHYVGGCMYLSISRTPLVIGGSHTPYSSDGDLTHSRALSKSLTRCCYAILLALTLQSALIAPSLAQSTPPPAASRPLMDRDKEIALALSSCPPAVAKAAGVYVLTGSGYEKARDSENGFTAIVQHSAPTATEPQCMDAEGSRTILQRYLRVAAWRAQGKTPEEIRQLTKQAFDKGELQAPTRPGVDYMLSNANTVPNEKGEHVPYVPHVMFFGTHLTNADLGVGKELGPDGQPIGPVYVAGEGSPYALVIVPVGSHSGMTH